MANILEKKLVDLQKEGKHLQTGVAHTKKGDKIFLYVDPAWSNLRNAQGEGIGLCAFTKDGRAITKDDSVVIWKKDGEYQAAVLNDSEKAKSKYQDLVLA